MEDAQLADTGPEDADDILTNVMILTFVSMRGVECRI
jgi:hypothetical protein